MDGILVIGLLWLWMRGRRKASDSAATAPPVKKGPSGPPDDMDAPLPGQSGKPSAGGAGVDSPPSYMNVNRLTNYPASYAKFLKIWKAVDYIWGTDEEALIAALKTLNFNEKQYLGREYRWAYWDVDNSEWVDTKHSLLWWIHDDLDDGGSAVELTIAMELLPALRENYGKG